MSNRTSRTVATVEETTMTMDRRMADLICGRSGSSRRRQRSRTTLTYALLLIVCTELTVSYCCYVFPKGIPRNGQQMIILFISYSRRRQWHQDVARQS